MRERWLLLAAILIAILCFPPRWYPEPLRLQLAQWFGPGSFRESPASLALDSEEPELRCPEDLLGWRNAQTIEGVALREASTLSLIHI